MKSIIKLVRYTGMLDLPARQSLQNKAHDQT